jgi:hypothetical protein
MCPVKTKTIGLRMSSRKCLEGWIKTKAVSQDPRTGDGVKGERVGLHTSCLIDSRLNIALQIVRGTRSSNSTTGKLLMGVRTDLGELHASGRERERNRLKIAWVRWIPSPTPGDGIIYMYTTSRRKQRGGGMWSRRSTLRLR